MTAYVKKVLAIHPRGRKYHTGIKRSQKFTETATGDLVSKLDFLASAIDDLLGDFKGEGDAAKSLFALTKLHSLHTKALSPEQQLRSSLKLIELLKPVKAALQRYYREGKLKSSINREDLHKFFKVVDEVLNQKDMILGLVEKVDSLKASLADLGFNINMEVLR